MTQALNKSSLNNKCVCQICTCNKHHCPHCDPSLPFDGTTTYDNEYHKHPINVHKKPKEQGPDLNRHYDYINSKYRQDYPGYNTGPVQKVKPKQPEKVDLPFYGTSDYKMNYGPKKVDVEKPFDTSKQPYQPTGPFNGVSTYKSDFLKKPIKTHPKKKHQEVEFPPGYKFNGDTTYKSDFAQKPYDKVKSYKPNQVLRETGPHDLQTMYRQDYVEKEMPCHCPILDLPNYSNKISAPYSHYGYDATKNKWFQKC